MSLSHDTSRALKPRRRPPQFIYDHDEGTVWVLATTEAEALAFARDDRGEEATVEFTGWMRNVGWDRDNYDTKREFHEYTGLTSWWEEVGGGIDSHVETAKLRRAFEVHVDA